MKSSNTVACAIRLRSIYWFGTLKSTLALIIFGSNFPGGTSANLGFNCTTNEEHQVIGSSSGTFPKLPCLSLVYTFLEWFFEVSMVRIWVSVPLVLHWPSYGKALRSPSHVSCLSSFQCLSKSSISCTPVSLTVLTARTH